MSSPRVSARIPARLHALLAGAAGRSAASQSLIIVEALESFLERPHTGQIAALERRIDKLSRQLERIERDGHLREEALGALIEFHFMATPPMDRKDRPEREKLRDSRWRSFESHFRRRMRRSRRTLASLVEEAAPAPAPDQARGEAGRARMEEASAGAGASLGRSAPESASVPGASETSASKTRAEEVPPIAGASPSSAVPASMVAFGSAARKEEAPSAVSAPSDAPPRAPIANPAAEKVHASGGPRAPSTPPAWAIALRERQLQREREQ